MGRLTRCKRKGDNSTETVKTPEAALIPEVVNTDADKDGGQSKSYGNIFLLTIDVHEQWAS